MSLDTLNSAHATLQSADEKTAVVTKDVGKPCWSLVNRFKERYPHFFTPDIIAARSSPLKTKTTAPEVQYWRTVASKVNGQGEIRHVALHREMRHMIFKIVCKITDNTWLITERTLMEVASARNEYVWVRLGSNDLRLSRQQLLDAYHALKELPLV